MMNWDYTMNGWMGGWMWIPLFLFLALLTLGMVALIRGMRTDPAPGAHAHVETPLAVAAGRLARGEITKAEYEELRPTLGGVS